MPVKSPVSLRAVIQRINRKLDEYKVLKKCRVDSRAYHTCGDFYILDTYRNFIVATHVDPESLAQELEVLADWEYVEEDAG
jgi:precorrin isomerase